MRPLSLFLSLYILLLCGMPCADAIARDTGQTVVLVKGQAGHHCDGNDHCSPFCTCNCCHVNMTISVALQMDASGVVMTPCHEMSPLIRDLFLPEFFIPPKA